MLIRCTPFLLVSALAAAAQMPAPLPAAPTTAVRLASNAAVPVPDTSLASPTLTRTQAEALALRNNPRASISHLLALAQHQIVRESRSAELPQLVGSITAQAVSQNGVRLASGGINDSRLFQHVGGGVLFNQLLTDFGHTSNLVDASRLAERAKQSSDLATREEVVLVADQAFYDALQAQALVQVAQQTVNTRQTTQGQINQLTSNHLRSTLDLSFANVDVSQAKLQQLDASDNASASMAQLDEVLGLDNEVTYTLVDAAETAAAPPPDVQPLIQLALRLRPDLASLDLQQQSEQKVSKAQSDQRLPTISAIGTLGGDPVRPGQYFVSSWDGAIGATISIPIFNGFLFSAQAEDARLHAAAATEQTRELRNQVVRDVRTAWLQANNAYLRIGVTAQLLDQASKSLGLAHTRYQLGLASIVELSQAQLQQTQAAISHTVAEYQYKLATATLNFQTGAQP